MARLFGTDGIRGRANADPLSPEMIVRVGRAIAMTLGGRSDAHIVVGADTRESGDMISSALISGICACGVHVSHAGIIPTPAVAHLTARIDSAMAGVVISASHNPYFDNGIKVFDGNGYKLSDGVEADIERRILDDGTEEIARSDQKLGRIVPLSDAEERYLEFLRLCWPENRDPHHLKLVIDCANGATYRVAPALFSSLGFDVTALFVDPDGRNINADCGSEHPRLLAEKVTGMGADIGLAFDGDGDRLAVVDDTGRKLTGDQVLAICAADLKSEGRLKNNRVVSTVMSNIGLATALNQLGIDHEVADVGDRRVMEKMKATGAILGGEDSGHIIFMDQHSTGDGLLSALRLISAMIRQNKPLSALAGIMTVAPQVLVNVPVSSKPDLDSLVPLQQVVSRVESELNTQGRVLVRYSGTQPMCRVMVEGPGREMTEKCCKEIAEVVSETIGNAS